MARGRLVSCRVRVGARGLDAERLLAFSAGGRDVLAQQRDHPGVVSNRLAFVRGRGAGVGCPRGDVPQGRAVAQGAWRVDADVDGPSCLVHPQVDTAEGPTHLVRLDDRDAVDAMRDAEVRMPRGDHVDKALGQRPRKLENLALRPAGGQIVRVGEALAAAAGMREHYDHRGAGCAQARCLAYDHIAQRHHLQVHEVARVSGLRRADGRHADQADSHSGHGEHRRGLDVAGCPGDAGPADDVGGEEGEARLSCPSFDVAGGVVARLARDGPAPHRAEVELVIAEGDGVVAECVVRTHDCGALPEVRLEGALPHVAGIHQQHVATLGATRGAEILHVSREPRQAFDVAVHIRRRDDGDRDGSTGRPCCGCRRLRHRTGTRGRQAQGDEQRAAKPHQRDRPSSFSPRGESVATCAWCFSQSRGSPGKAGRCG